MRNLIINMLFVCMLLSEKLSNDVRWVVNSKEYEVLCHQVYNQAKKDLINIWIRGKAVVMDLDETVLDNSQYQIELHKNNQTFNIKLSLIKKMNRLI